MLRSGTTDSGLTYLKNPLNEKGTFIIKPGQYDAWSLGFHKGTREALVQDQAAVTGYRDNNKDDILDLKPNTLEKGYYRTS